MSLGRLFAAGWVALVVLAVAPARGEAFAPKGGRFTASFPAPPKEETTTLQTAAGMMVIRTSATQTKDGAYIVAYFDLPAGVPPAERIDMVLDGGVGGMVTNTQGTLVSSDRLELAGFPAREAVWSYRDGNAEGRGRARLVLVGARLYQVFVLGGEAFASSKPALDYLKSFTFEPAPGVKAPTKPQAPRPVPSAPVPAPAGPPAEWQTFNVKNNDGGYTVEFPGKPDKDQAPGILGIKARTVFTCSAEGLTFTVMGQPVTAPTLKRAGASGVLAASRDALAAAHNGKVTSDRAVRVGAYSAREVRITSATLRPNVLRARSVLAGRRLYTVLVEGPEPAVSGPSAQKFLDSFTPTQ